MLILIRFKNNKKINMEMEIFLALGIWLFKCLFL
jgi:hypothetical protein